MLHARRDYDPIQDPRGLIPKDEPVMLFRAQDKYAVVALRAYREMLIRNQGDPRLIETIEEQIERFNQWPKKKEPDLAIINPKQTVRS